MASPNPPQPVNPQRSAGEHGQEEPSNRCRPQTPARSEIARLPEELLSAMLSLTTPRDAGRAAAVSPAFCAAGDSDAVWSCFLPRNLPPLADGELPHPPPSNKCRFLRLADRPVILRCGLMSMWLDKETGVKCFMLPARRLNITWGDKPGFWRWIKITRSSFSEAAKLLHIGLLEIRGTMNSKMLSQNSTYGAYLVFKIASRSYGLERQEQSTSVSLGGNNSIHRVCLGDNQYSHGDGHLEIPQNLRIPRKRRDGWKELEMGEFYSEKGEDGEVCISLTEMSDIKKSGLIVLGIEIRPTKASLTDNAV